MAYINGIRSLAHLSARRPEVKKRKFTDQWANALFYAENALWILRQADNYAEKYEWRKAETTANDGVEVLKKSVFELPSETAVHEELTNGCDWPVCLEESLIKEFESSWNMTFR
ncbi:hypothetical protein BJX63DRAFT_410443 [Aspergillus granulosus]|uniref:Uncharacterized protein n=1 Tax=Aspergillus granulosus TaxID=176169 RepID=A0ABR4GZQ2_9EURO